MLAGVRGGRELAAEGRKGIGAGGGNSLCFHCDHTAVFVGMSGPVHRCTWEGPQHLSSPGQYKSKPWRDAIYWDGENNLPASIVGEMVEQLVGT